jgi:hypothetical protein
MAKYPTLLIQNKEQGALLITNKNRSGSGQQRFKKLFFILLDNK